MTQKIRVIYLEGDCCISSSWELKPSATAEDYLRFPRGEFFIIFRDTGKCIEYPQSKEQILYEGDTVITWHAGHCACVWIIPDCNYNPTGFPVSEGDMIADVVPAVWREMPWVVVSEIGQIPDTRQNVYRGDHVFVRIPSVQ